MGLFSRKKKEHATDPVCGMTVDPLSAAGKADHGGKTYYFCSQDCQQKFTMNPSRYVM